MIFLQDFLLPICELSVLPALWLFVVFRYFQCVSLRQVKRSEFFVHGLAELQELVFVVIRETSCYLHSPGQKHCFQAGCILCFRPLTEFSKLADFRLPWNYFHGYIFRPSKCLRHCTQIFFKKEKQGNDAEQCGVDV